MQKWTKRQYFQRVEDIEKKYEPLMMYWRRDAATWSSADHARMRESSLILRVKGFNAAFQILKAQTKREIAESILIQQETEPGVPEYFKQVVRLVLDDLQAEKLAPLNLPNLLV